MPRQVSLILKCAALLCGALALGACTTLGPDYQEPQVDWLQDWQSSVYGQADSGAAADEADIRFWWRQFNDPVLDRLIELARQENPSLRIAGLRILESRAQLGIAGSTLYPQVQQGTGAVTYVNNRYHGGNVPDDRQSFVGYQAGFNIGWELDFWGRFKRGIESADAAFFASISDQQDVQVLLNAQVADLYFAYRTTQLRITIARVLDSAVVVQIELARSLGVVLTHECHTRVAFAHGHQAIDTLAAAPMTQGGALSSPQYLIGRQDCAML